MGLINLRGSDSELSEAGLSVECSRQQYTSTSFEPRVHLDGTTPMVPLWALAKWFYIGFDASSGTIKKPIEGISGFSSGAHN